jgi:thioredoxin-related protein
MKIVLGIATPVLLALILWAPKAIKTSAAIAPASSTVQWMTWEEAIKKSEKEPKKIFVDLYTDWCGWCKRMDSGTFADAAVADYINKHFYPVKFNAEQRADINYKGHTLKFVANGSRGYHELAYSLLDGRMGYPSMVYLDENQNRITISPGYKPEADMLRELKYVAEEHYKKMPFDQYKGK